MNLNLYLVIHIKVYITYIMGSYMYCQILDCTVTYLDVYMLNTSMIYNSHTIFTFYSTDIS